MRMLMAAAAGVVSRRFGCMAVSGMLMFVIVRMRVAMRMVVLMAI
jgi:hypothetical protein